MTAQGDLTTAYNNAAGLPSPPPVLAADIGGQTLPPGVYKATTTLGITGNLTLDGSTNPNGVWVFQVGSALTTAAGALGNPASQVLLIGGAQAHNVFWVIGSSATLGTFSLMQGTIMAKASITLGTGATLDGRALAETGAVTLDTNNVNLPPCP
jgi:ice-binding like protein